MRTAPTRGYNLPIWGLIGQYRATAIAYCKRTGARDVECYNGEMYTLEELENSIIKWKH